MDTFTQKLRVIYTKLFNENIDSFTEALIDYKKFNQKKFDGENKTDNKKQFFMNRKTVLRRWLQKGNNCTPDFQKSYPNYKLSHYQFKGESLFKISDFREEDNLAWFDQRIEDFLQHQKRAEVKSNYRYLYMYCELENKIVYYEILTWIKGANNSTELLLKKEEKEYHGTFKLTDDSNILISITTANNTLYMLFHESHDTSSLYTVGVSMGYLHNDNKVPRSQKLVFSKALLKEQQIELEFMLNETEVISAIENRLNLHSQEVKVNHFVKYANKLKRYSDFFKHLRHSSFEQNFYYRLAFREFYATQRLFKKVAKEESYYIVNYQQAFLELLKTVASISNISLQVVMQLDENNLFLQSGQADLEIRSRFLNLYNEYHVKTTIIFVIESYASLNTHIKLLLSDMQKHNIQVKIIEKESIVNEVDSLNFSFIHLNDKRDFVLADPIRDSKDVYKLFTSQLTMDEYRTDYQRFIEMSKVYNAED